MIGRKLSHAAVVCTVALSCWAVPTESYALFDLFFPHWRHPWHHNATPATTYYAPMVAPAVPQTCSYMPQTCYRTVCANVPVTTYRPVTTCDPCTGCPTTCLRPVTSYVLQPRLMPYTTYRPVAVTSCSPCAVPACPTGACGAAPTTTYSMPTVSTLAPSTGCGTCQPTYSPTATTLGGPGTVIRSLTTPPPVGTLQSPVPTPAPAQNSTETTGPRTTFEQQNTNSQPAESQNLNNESGMRVIPDYDGRTTNTILPRASERRDRTTSLGTQRNWAYKTVSAVEPQPQATPEAKITGNVNNDDVDFGGWRAAK